MPVIAPPTASATGTRVGRTGPADGPTMTRRRVLQLTAASVLGITLGGCSGLGDKDQRAQEDPTAFWSVIADTARKQDPKLSLRVAETELASVGGSSQIRRPSVTRRRALQQRITDDFTAGRTILVQGWLLARTEVLAAILVTAPAR